MNQSIVYSVTVILFILVLAMIDQIFGIRRRIAAARRPMMTAQDVANRLHRLADEGVDGINWSRLDLDDFVVIHTVDFWRIGILLKHGDLSAVANVRSKEFKEPEVGDRQPLVVLREQWPDDMQELQDIIAAALKRDGSI